MWGYYNKFDSTKSLVVCYWCVKIPQCGYMGQGLRLIAFYVQKHIAALAASLPKCHNPLLVRNKPLGVPASVKQVSCRGQTLGRLCPHKRNPIPHFHGWDTGVFREFFHENWLRYIKSALYIAVKSATKATQGAIICCEYFHAYSNRLFQSRCLSQWRDFDQISNLIEIHLFISIFSHIYPITKKFCPC